MKKILVTVLLVLLLAGLAASYALGKFGTAARAWLFGYPLVLMDATSRASAAHFGPDDRNRFIHSSTFPDHRFRAVVKPNNDTLYSAAWLDLSGQPVVLSVPDTQGRYYVMPLMDAWTNVFAMVGKRTTGTGAGSWLIAGPDWEGATPAGLELIRSPTDLVWLLGRIQTNGRDDVPAVTTLQQQFTLAPLSLWQEGRHNPPLETGAVPADREVSPKEEVAQLSAAEFLARMTRLMQAQPPAAADAPVLAEFAGLAILQGQVFDLEQSGPVERLLIERGVAYMRDHLPDELARRRTVENGWFIPRGSIGNYGTDYGMRAGVALVGLGALPPAEASYPSTSVDSAGRPLSGEYRYRIRFAPGETPPADAFWSLTLYDDEDYLVDNPIGRYAIGDRDPLVYQPDGSLDLRIQHEQPPERASNWLPAPAGNFTLTLRIYMPRDVFLEGKWSPPAVERLEEGAP